MSYTIQRRLAIVFLVVDVISVVKTDVVTKESLCGAGAAFSQDAALTLRFLRVYELAGLVTDFYYAILHAQNARTDTSH